MLREWRAGENVAGRRGQAAGDACLQQAMSRRTVQPNLSSVWTGMGGCQSGDGPQPSVDAEHFLSFLGQPQAFGKAEKVVLWNTFFHIRWLVGGQVG